MRRTILGGAFTAAAVFACSGDSSSATGLVLGLQLDLAVPSDTDHVAVLVTLIEGNRRTAQAPASLSPIDKSGVSFVATLVLESHNPEDRVQVRFIAFDAAGKVRAMREALTRVPQDGTALLRMPLLWINDGLVQDSGSGPLTSGAGDLAFASASVGTQTLTDDGFTRLSMIGCAAEQTRGNDGACRPIAADGELEPLLNSSVTIDPGPCLDLQACFIGSEVRSFDLSTLRNCDLPIDMVAGTPKPALAFTGPSTGGFPIVSESGVTALIRPGDDALYTYLPDRGVLHLNEALCAKVARDGIPTAIVSAKCAPKKTDTLVCASYNDSKGVVATDAGVFEGDSGPSDAGPDATDGDAATKPVLINETVTLNVTNASVYSFAARNAANGSEGSIWLLAARPEDDGGKVLTIGWPNPTSSPAKSVPPQLYYGFTSKGQIVIGANKRAYLLAAKVGEGGGHYGLGDGTIASEPVTICQPGTCGVSAACANGFAPEFFSAGEQIDKTGGIYAMPFSTGGPAHFLGGAFAPPTGSAGCFESRPSGSDASASATLRPGDVDTLSPGIRYGDTYLAALRVASVDGALSTDLVQSSDTSLAVTSQLNGELVAAFGPNRMMTTHFTDLHGVYTTLFEEVVEVGGKFGTGQTLSPHWYAPRELFGGPNVACMRTARDEYSASVVVCVRKEGTMLETVLPSLDGTSYIGDNADLVPFDPHVYADPDFLYIGQACTDTKFSIRGVPWSALQSAAQIQQAFVGICGGNLDGGASLD